MWFAAEDFATWSAGLPAGARCAKLTTRALSGDQEHALRQADTTAIQLTVLADHLNDDVTQVRGQPIIGALPNWGTRCSR